jgi:hypothetical protein
MKTLPLGDPRDGLMGLRLGIEAAARNIGEGRLDAADLHAVVEADLATLGDVARDIGHAEPDQTSRQVALDAVASHLLAAVDASLSGVRPEVVADLLWRAADRLRVAA